MFKNQEEIKQINNHHLVLRKMEIIQGEKAE